MPPTHVLSTGQIANWRLFLGSPINHTKHCELPFSVLSQLKTARATLHKLYSIVIALQMHTAMLSLDG